MLSAALRTITGLLEIGVYYCVKLRLTGQGGEEEGTRSGGRTSMRFDTQEGKRGWSRQAIWTCGGSRRRCIGGAHDREERPKGEKSP